ncbi:hypothetical protein R1flu_016109 [Riccia fluitans]|uniref:Reverse transcriptase domain-containing protein n=1 Tax=Riccia fluitans TaxID=41844 RepID=A0ABD1YL32_9MARC
MKESSKKEGKAMTNHERSNEPGSTEQLQPQVIITYTVVSSSDEKEWSHFGKLDEIVHQTLSKVLNAPPSDKEMTASKEEDVIHREDKTIGATTFRMTEGMIPPRSWKEIKMSDMKGILSELGTHRIDLRPNPIPIRQEQYRLNDKYSLLVKKNLDNLLKAGFIYPVLSSEWVSPIVVIPKKATGKIRVSQDFQKPNNATLKDHHPLPFTDVILDQVPGHECYSFLDGFLGYNQVFLRPEDCEKTTFTIDWGTFAYRVMPFGLTNAPATFQQMMMNIFRDYLWKFVKVFLDDFCVYSSKKDHKEKLGLTFEKCRPNQLRLHPKKSYICMQEGILLGHRISC